MEIRKRSSAIENYGFSTIPNDVWNSCATKTPQRRAYQSQSSTEPILNISVFKTERHRIDFVCEWENVCQYITNGFCIGCKTHNRPNRPMLSWASSENLYRCVRRLCTCAACICERERSESHVAPVWVVAPPLLVQQQFAVPNIQNINVATLTLHVFVRSPQVIYRTKRRENESFCQKTFFSFSRRTRETACSKTAHGKFEQQSFSLHAVRRGKWDSHCIRVTLCRTPT